MLQVFLPLEFSHLTSAKTHTSISVSLREFAHRQVHGLKTLVSSESPALFVSAIVRTMGSIEGDAVKLDSLKAETSSLVKQIQMFVPVWYLTLFFSAAPLAHRCCLIPPRLKEIHPPRTHTWRRVPLLCLVLIKQHHLLHGLFRLFDLILPPRLRS